MIKKLLRSKAVWVAVLTLLGTGFALLLDMTIAAHYGASALSDAIVIALMLPLLLDTVTREGTKFSLVALFTKRRDNDDAAAWQTYLNQLFVLSLLIGVGLLLLLQVAAYWIIWGLGPDLPAEERSSAIVIFRLMGLMYLVFPAVNVLSAYLNSRKKFYFVSFRQTFVAALVIATFFLFKDQTEHAEYLFGIGYSVGVLAYFLFLYLMSWREGWRFHWAGVLKGKAWRELRGAVSWSTLGFGARQTGRMFEKSIASTLFLGGAASYYFAFRIFKSIQTVVGSSLAITSLPDMAKLVGKPEAMRRSVLKRALVVFVFVVPVMLVLGFGASWIIEKVFMRGSFTQEDADRATEALYYLLPCLPFFTLTPVLNSALYALQAFRKVFYNLLSLSVINVVLAYFLGQAYGIAGISVSVSITAVLSNIISLILLRSCGVRILRRNAPPKAQ